MAKKPAPPAKKSASAAKKPSAKGAKPVGGSAAPPPVKVSVWALDPGWPGENVKRVLRTVPAVPAPGGPLSYQIVGYDAQPDTGPHKPTTPAFRYWNFVEAAKRCLALWRDVTPPGTGWHGGGPLHVQLDGSEDLNAYYARGGTFKGIANAGLWFCHAWKSWDDGGNLYTGESPQVVWHEMGHAVLDAIRPALYQPAIPEVVAFHEAFADLSAVLTGLTVPNVAEEVVEETRGYLYRLSRVTRFAPQLGRAVEDQYPDRTFGRALRTPVVNLYYKGYKAASPISSAWEISREPHNTSRVFSAAVIYALDAAITTAQVGRTAALLRTQARYLARLLAVAAGTAPVMVGFYRSVATAMVQAALTTPHPELGRHYPHALVEGFQRFGVIRPGYATKLKDALKKQPPTLPTVGGMPFAATTIAEVAPPQTVQVPTRNLFTDFDSVTVELPVSLFGADALGAVEGSKMTDKAPDDVVRAVNLYLKQLLTQRHLAVNPKDENVSAPGRESHRVVRTGKRGRLERLYFD